MKTTLALALGFLFAIHVPYVGFAASPPEYLSSFDLAKGFKPAQADLTEIFLQIAASIESNGSPVPYLRHMVEERTRIEDLYSQKYGVAPTSYWPAYMTNAYVERVASNWKILATKFGLEAFAKDVSHTMRDAIKGTRGTGTVLIDVFNQHQSHVFDQMAGKGGEPADFDALKSQILATIEFDKEKVDAERYEIGRRDAIDFALGIRGSTDALFRHLDEQLSAADAKKVKGAITSVFNDVGRLAQCELQLGILEWGLTKKAPVNR